VTRIRTLDGIRGIAIVLVLLGHTAANYNPLGPELRRWLVVFANPQTGVRLFFVLSGYLITKLLLAERERTGRISLWRFYGRRALRIFPAYYVYLLLLALSAPWLTPEIGKRCWLAAVTFTWNYSSLWISPAPTEVWNLGHTWTLAMEQQFYLLWPLLFLLRSRRRLGWFVAALIVWCPVARVSSYFLFPSQRGLLTVMFHTGCDSLIVGCAAALLLHSRGRLPVLRSWGNPVALGATIWLALVSPVTGELIRGFPVAIGYTIDAGAAAWLIAWLDHAPPPWASRVLGSRLLVGLGVLSYSLYLWQQPFLAPSGPLGRGHWVLPVGGALAAATASLFGVERPFLRWRARRQPASD